MLNCYLKQQIFQKCGKTLTNTMWHSELFYSMFEETKSRNAVLQKELTEPLKDYLGFRHVFRHSYGYELDWLRLNPLFSGMADVWQKVKETWKNFFLLCDILHLHQSRIIYIMFSCSTMSEFLFIRSKTRYFQVLFSEMIFSSGETSDSNCLKT